jgi:hypothetical protein
MEYALMVLAGCSGFTVAGVCYSCNMRGINFYGSLENFKKSIGMPTSRDTDEEVVYPKGFTPYPEGFTPYPKGFTPNASVPKTPQKVQPNYRKLNEDAGNVRRMKDRLKSQQDAIFYTIVNNLPATRSALEDKEKKTILDINRARKNVGKGPNKGRK